AAEAQALLLDARARLGAGDFVATIDLCQRALQLRPGDPEALALLAQADGLRQRAEWEAARRLAWERQQAELRELARGQEELALGAEAAGRGAEEEARMRAAAERATWERQCALASQRLAAEARVPLQTGNVTLSVQLLEGATALGPAAPPALYDDLARA